eukprot:Opistho-1_new@106271
MAAPVENLAAAVGGMSVEAKAPAPAKHGGGDKKKGKAKGDAPAGPLELDPKPDYIEHRNKIFDRLKKQYDEEVAAKTPEPIEITLPDGKVVQGQSWRTTPLEIALGISKGLADNTIIAKVDGEVFDLERPLERSCRLALLKWDSDEAKAVYWHSSAHIVGEALELRTGGCLCYGPPIEQGFYYDIYLGDKTIHPEEFPALETISKRIMKDGQKFERLEMSKADLLEMFKYNEFKRRIITERIQEERTTVYRCGPLIDLCRGPHVRDTGRIKALMITKGSASYWEGNAEAESLQRVYGISFPDAKQLAEWQKLQEEAAKRDHRKIGKEQELYFFHELSPGSCFFLPHGARVYNKLIALIRGEYVKRGFQEVITPNMYNSKLWQTSGHWEHYSENMFKFEIEKETFALKPMNCPGHCLMFDHRVRSYKELPLRMADFGVLHRNELSGALTGLTRVRRFQQDDAHIFCAEDQIEAEIDGALDFLQAIYGIFGFQFSLALSTRPENYLGDLAVWERAESQLAKSLDRFTKKIGSHWKENPKDGAFYGPKIDITIMDALKRPHQCATIQLDFNLPNRFNLSYMGAETEEKKRPVIIHRAILGSVERMIAILTESFGGKWPFWLSPRQAIVLPISSKFQAFAEEVRAAIHDAGYYVDIDNDDGLTLAKKVLRAQTAQFNYILVIGEREQQNRTVNVRTRDNKVHGEHSLDSVLARFGRLEAEHVADDNAEF